MVANRDAFDLFSFLGTLSKRKANSYTSLSEDGQKAASPYVIARWLTGTDDVEQLVRLNTFVNPYIFALGQEKDLLFKLMAASCTSRTGRYTWTKIPGAKQDRLQLDVIKQYYGVSTREATSYQVDSISLLGMAQELGWDDDQLKKLKKELET